MYLDERPWEIITERKGDITSARVVVTVQAPLRLSVIAGDCLTNARAALDYTMWELTNRFFTVPIDLSIPEHRVVTAFPLLDNPVAYQKRLLRLTHFGVPAAVSDEIKPVQPYNAGYEPLWWLHELVNADKHRAPRLTTTYAPVFAYQIDERGTVLPLPHWGPERETKPTPAELEAMQVEHQVALQVTLKDVLVPRESVDLTLQKIIETVANVIPRFERFFVV